MKKFLALILSLAMVFALVACGGEKTDDSQNNDGDSSSPVAITLATGGTSGTYYAVGGVLKTVLDSKLTLSTLNVESTGASVANVNMITDGEAQMAILQSDVINYAHEGTNSFDGAPETDALWVAGIYNETVQILAKPGINTVADLKGKKISVQNGSSAQTILENSAIKDDITISPIATNVEALQQLELGVVDVVFLDEVVADYEIKNSGKDYKKLAEGLEEEQYAIAFRKNDQALRDAVQKTLSEMKADGKLGEISTKWFGSDITIVK